jgi:hypothetical protein
MDFLDDGGLCQYQQLIVAFDIMGKIQEPASGCLAPVLGFSQLVALDHGAHGTIKDEDPLRQQRVQGVFQLTNESGRSGARVHRGASARVTTSLLL